VATMISSPMPLCSAPSERPSHSERLPGPDARGIQLLLPNLLGGLAGAPGELSSAYVIR
jgi:hypothetical protein